MKKKGRKKRKRYCAEQNRQSGKNPKEFMTECMAVQAQISDYIDGSLPAEHMERFVHHVEHCMECREELKIYYTLYLGILQLDREEEVKELSDLDGALEEELEHSENQIHRRRFVQSIRYAIYTTAFWCVVTAVLLQLRMFADLGIL